MKPYSRSLLGLVAVSLILASLIQPFPSVLAQDGASPWGEFLNPDGSINWANLTYLGETCRAGGLDERRDPGWDPGAAGPGGL